MADRRRVMIFCEGIKVTEVVLLGLAGGALDTTYVGRSPRSPEERTFSSAAEAENWFERELSEIRQA